MIDENSVIYIQELVSRAESLTDSEASSTHHGKLSPPTALVSIIALVSLIAFVEILGIRWHSYTITVDLPVEAINSKLCFIVDHSHQLVYG